MFHFELDQQTELDQQMDTPNRTVTLDLLDD